MRPTSVTVQILSFLMFLSAATASAADVPLPLSDRAAIQAVLEQFREGWVSGNANAVRNAFTSDAVLMPHHGVPPVVGMAAIKEFWWPVSTVTTTITRFGQTLDEIGGEGYIGYVRGRSDAAWTIENQTSTEKWQNRGNFMALLRKQSDGKWLISHLIWDDPPNQRVN